MNRTGYTIVAGFLAAAIGFAAMGFAAAAETNSRTAQIRANSPAAKAPVIARVVVTPSAEQMAKIRMEGRMTGSEGRATVAQHAAGAPPIATGAL